MHWPKIIKLECNFVQFHVQYPVYILLLPAAILITKMILCMRRPVLHTWILSIIPTGVSRAMRNLASRLHTVLIQFRWTTSRGYIFLRVIWVGKSSWNTIRSLLVGRSNAKEIRKNFQRSPERCIRVVPIKQWLYSDYSSRSDMLTAVMIATEVFIFLIVRFSSQI